MKIKIGNNLKLRIKMYARIFFYSRINILEAKLKGMMPKKIISRIKATMRYGFTFIRMAIIKNNGKQQVLAKMQQNWNLCALLVNM